MRVHELNEANSVSDGVIKSYGQYEPSAYQTRYLKCHDKKYIQKSQVQSEEITFNATTPNNKCM